MNLKIILILSITHLFIDITGSAIPAMMPFIKEALKLSYTSVGAIIMVSNLTSSIIQPFFGYISDRINVKWLLPVSVFLTYVGLSFMGLSTSFFILIILVMMTGIGVAAYHPEGTKVMHHFTGLRKATGMAFFQVGGNFGLALGPLLVTFAIKLANLKGTLLFLLIGIPILGLLLIFFKDITIPFKSKEESHEARIESHSIREGNGWKNMILLILAVSMRSWAHMGLITFAPFYYIHILHGDPISAGRLVFVFLMGGVLGTMIGGIIADRVGHKLLFGSSMLISIPFLFLLLTVEGFWVFVVIFLIGFSLISSFSVTIVMGQMILRERLGMASGLTMGFVIGMGGIGAGLLGMVADSWGIITVVRLIALMPAAGFIPIVMISYPNRI